MKPGKPRKAPKIKAPSKKKPNYMKESDKGTRKKTAMWPLRKKTLSK